MARRGRCAGRSRAKTGKERSRRGESEDEDARPGGAGRFASRCSHTGEDRRRREGGDIERKTLCKADSVN
ncbi:hypothetical protein NDU88_004335 [Pleurodeles waltl]|uniref:Uncharacterized protein n=1 Tax=Pleurodeles waltl TaxID=8319 RepID=A0AAV7M626_PLEWA|nr:hypothetical protein NDU88_004335 [Pleurodeles waltl]